VFMNQDKIEDLFALYRESFVAWSDRAARLRNIQATGPEAGVANAQSLMNEAEASYREKRDRLTEEMMAGGELQ
jgi:hypothetical protein